MAPDGALVRTIVLVLLAAATSVTQGPVMAPAAAPPGVEVVSAAPEQRAATHRAVERFERAGLELPAVVVRFSAEKGDCHGHLGFFRPGVRPWTVTICSDLAFVVTHELAHAWIEAHLDEPTRSAYLELRAKDTWNGREAEWRERGVEDAAFVIQQNLMASPPSHLSAEWASRVDANELLTGHASPLRPTTPPAASTASGQLPLLGHFGEPDQFERSADWARLLEPAQIIARQPAQPRSNWSNGGICRRRQNVNPTSVSPTTPTCPNHRRGDFGSGGCRFETCPASERSPRHGSRVGARPRVSRRRSDVASSGFAAGSRTADSTVDRWDPVPGLLEGSGLCTPVIAADGTKWLTTWQGPARLEDGEWVASTEDAAGTAWPTLFAFAFAFGFDSMMVWRCSDVTGWSLATGDLSQPTGQSESRGPAISQSRALSRNHSAVVSELPSTNHTSRAPVRTPMSVSCLHHSGVSDEPEVR